MTLEDIIKETKTYYCLECGKCSSLCPISRHNPSYSPRLMLEKALTGFEGDLINDQELFSCLTCYNCSLKCPADVDYPLFMQKVRTLAFAQGRYGVPADSGILQSFMRLMLNPAIEQRRLEWLSDEYRISEKGNILFFVGCAPYFEFAFEDFEAGALNIAKDSLKILNTLGIEPMVLADEKCCGHDLLWTGDVESFRKLAEHNARIIKESGAKKIIFSCPEGYRTFKFDYPHYVDLDCELQHITEFLAENMGKGMLDFKEVKKKVTYQDPCRLGRHLGVYEQPRKLIEAIPGIELIEMEHTRDESICCGTSAWTNCDAYSKQIRTERLLEAKATGAEMLITACPKCQIHFRCAMVSKGEEKGPDVEMDVMDIVNLVASALEDNGSE